MPTIDDLELPIRREKVDGPAVRALADRKEDNNNTRATVERFKQNYAPVKQDVLSGLKGLSEARPR